MDPLSITSGAAGLVVSCAAIVKMLYSWIDVTVDVDENVSNLLEEVLILSRVLDSISNASRQVPQTVMDEIDPGNGLWASITATLGDIENTTNKLKQLMAELEKRSLFSRGFLRKPTKQIKFSLRSKDITIYKDRIKSYNTAMTSALQMINVCLLIHSNSSQDSVFKVLSELKSQVRSVEFALQTSSSASPVTPVGQAEDDRVTQNLRHFVQVAENFHSSASTIVRDGPRSTVWGGSIMGDPLTEAQAHRIQGWIPPPANEELHSPVDAGSQSDSDNEAELARRIEELAIRNETEGDHAKAERFYRSAIDHGRASSRSASDITTMRVRLAYACLRQEKWTEADEVITPIAFERRINDILVYHGMHALALAYLDGSKLEEAERYCKRAFWGKKKILGKDHSSCEETLTLLVSICMARNKTVEAEAHRSFIPNYSTIAVDPDPLTYLDRSVGSFGGSNNASDVHSQTGQLSTAPAEDIGYLVELVPRFMRIASHTNPATIRGQIMCVVGIETSLRTCALVRDEVVRRRAARVLAPVPLPLPSPPTMTQDPPNIPPPQSGQRIYQQSPAPQQQYPTSQLYTMSQMQSLSGPAPYSSNFQQPATFGSQYTSPSRTSSQQSVQPYAMQPWPTMSGSEYSPNSQIPRKAIANTYTSPLINYDTGLSQSGLSLPPPPQLTAADPLPSTYINSHEPQGYQTLPPLSPYPFSMADPKIQIFVSISYMKMDCENIRVAYFVDGLETPVSELLTEWPGSSSYSKSSAPTVLYYDQYQKVIGWGHDVANATSPTGDPKPGVQRVDRLPLYLAPVPGMMSSYELPPLPDGLDATRVSADFLYEVRLAICAALQKSMGLVFEEHEQRIHWILTIPSVWEQMDRIPLRRVFERAGYLRDEYDRRLAFVSEAEASAHRSTLMGYLKLNYKDTFIFVDCGNMMVGVSAYQLMQPSPLVVSKLGDGSVQRCGPSLIRQSFAELVRTKIRLTNLPNGSKTAGRIYAKCMADFDERIKTDFRNNGENWDIDVGIATDFPEAGIRDGYMEYKNQDILSCFRQSTNQIVDLLRRWIIEVSSTSLLQGILIVGEFSASEFLMREIRSQIPESFRLKTFRPSDPESEIVTGAVYLEMSRWRHRPT